MGLIKMLMPYGFFAAGAVVALQIQTAHGESLIPPGGGAGSVIVLIVTTVVGFLTMITQQFFAAAQQRRNHEYDLQDRKEKAEALLVQTKWQAELLARQTEANNAELKLMLERRAEALRSETVSHVESLKGMMEDQKTENLEILKVAKDTNKQVSDAAKKSEGDK